MKKDKNYWIKYWDSKAVNDNNGLSVAGYCEQGKTASEDSLKPVYNDINQKLEIQTDDLFLEVGCGSGVQIENIKKTTNKIVGLDPAKNMLEFVKNKFSVNVIQSLSDNMPFGSGVFDKILCYAVFHYFPDYKYAKNTIKEMLRILKQNGKILLGDIPNIEKQNIYYDLLNRGNKLNNLKSKIKYILVKNRIIKSSIELFYPKKYFMDLSNEVDFPIKVEIKEKMFDNSLPIYKLNIRYDVIITKL